MQRIAILILAAAVAVSAAKAQPGAASAETSGLTPEAAVELALANNPALVRSRVDLAAAERAQIGRAHV